MNKNKTILAVVTLYAITWIGGWITHARDMQCYVRRMYDNAQLRDREKAELLQKAGLTVEDTAHKYLKDGPKSGVDWCIPILPGVLLLNSWYVVGPLWGKGGVKVVLYYGLGTKEIAYLWGWIS